ncbi:MAG: glutamate-semialdehyde -aminomutase [Chloroflexota bacterium]|nr:glutamate-semialdehyde -aminomutase [Chloroflexota bacterium]
MQGSDLATIDPASDTPMERPYHRHMNGRAEGPIDRRKLAEIKTREDAAFIEARPKSMAMWAKAKSSMPNGVPMSWHRTSYDHPPLWVAEGSGGHFRDVDGHDYADFNIADMSMFGGYGPEPVVEALADRAAAGGQFLLPTEESIWVAEELTRRYRLPMWQFTSSATHANTEVIRIARAATGRNSVLFFEGKYHGHFDDVLVEPDKDGRLIPEESGLPDGVTERTKVVPWNDPKALAAALEPRDVAIVITEPVLTNNVGLLLPDEDWHAQLRSITKDTGTLLAYDETHTQVVGAGGLTSMWDLHPDIITIGKSIAAGVPLGAYGMTPEVAEVIERPAGRDDERPQVAIGGTLFGNPLAMAAAKATMSHVLTSEAYARTHQLGASLADGIEKAISESGLPWTAHRFWPRSGTTFAPSMPRDAREAYTSKDVELILTFRVYLANRGVWEAIVGAGPTCSVPATADDVSRYVDAYAGLVRELTG